MAETIQYTADRLAAFISQNYADIETGPGSVISELLIKLAAALQNEQYNNIATLNQGKSISSVMDSTTDSYSPVMDLIASNYNTIRSTGVQVSGKLKITVDRINNYSFNAGFVFTQPALNLNYTLINSVRVSTTPTTALNEVQLYESQGFYYFILDVMAESVGPEYQVASGTVFTVAAENRLTGFVSATAYGNFTSGKAPETDKELIGKIKSNLGNTRFESAAGIANNFGKTFAGFQSLSVCGANDAEMVRSKQNALGISTFGKADVYVRSSMGPETLKIKKSATKTAENTWVMAIANADVPGFYDITAILPIIPNVNLGGTLVRTKPIEFDFSFYPGQRNNEILLASEARFTKYQTAVITFTYADSPSSPIGTTENFSVQATYQPDILEMQDLLLQDTTRLACADYLVKAAIPCDVTLKINLVKKRTTDTFESLNLQQLKKDIFTYVNTLPFGEALYASNIVNICHNYDIKHVDLPVFMIGVITCPDNTNIIIEDTDVLTIPQAIEKGVSPKTTLYFINYYKVDSSGINPIDNIGLNIA